MAFFFLSKLFLRYAKKSRAGRAVGRAREEGTDGKHREGEFWPSLLKDRPGAP